jgi:hypothetical protein
MKLCAHNVVILSEAKDLTKLFFARLCRVHSNCNREVPRMRSG